MIHYVFQPKIQLMEEAHIFISRLVLVNIDSYQFICRYQAIKQLITIKQVPGIAWA